MTSEETQPSDMIMQVYSSIAKAQSLDDLQSIYNSCMDHYGEDMIPPIIIHWLGAAEYQMRQYDAATHLLPAWNTHLPIVAALLLCILIIGGTFLVVWKF